MGNGHSSQDEALLEAILTNQEAQVAEILAKDNTRVNAPLLNGKPSPSKKVNLSHTNEFRHDEPNLKSCLFG